MLKNILLVGAGGFVGSVGRYMGQLAVERFVSTTFPIGTFVVNMLGCFIIGIVFALSEKGNLLSPEGRLLLAVGICGGFTTFSSFAYNNLNLLKDSSLIYLLLNVFGSVCMGIVAVYLGILLMRSIL